MGTDLWICCLILLITCILLMHPLTATHSFKPQILHSLSSWQVDSFRKHLNSTTDLLSPLATLTHIVSTCDPNTPAPFNVGPMRFLAVRSRLCSHCMAALDLPSSWKTTSWGHSGSHVLPTSPLSDQDGTYILQRAAHFLSASLKDRYGYVVNLWMNTLLNMQTTALPQITQLNSSASSWNLWPPHPCACPNHCHEHTDRAQKANFEANCYVDIIYCSVVLALLNINIYIWKVEYCKFGIIQYVHSSISFLRNKLGRQRRNYKQVTLLFISLTQTWYCSVKQILKSPTWPWRHK